MMTINIDKISPDELVDILEEMSGNESVIIFYHGMSEEYLVKDYLEMLEINYLESRVEEQEYEA